MRKKLDIADMPAKTQQGNFTVLTLLDNSTFYSDLLLREHTILEIDPL